ncbi:MAG TPA: AEC family transporter [Polyangiaceae bacterium]|nr:AEC family transporter [Polyangiaceae bacterium]
MGSALFLVCCLLFAGYAARRLQRLPENAAEVLNRFVIDICVPATVLRLVPKMTVSASLAVLVVVPWVMAGLAYLTSRLAQRLLALDENARTALFLATALGNTSFLGFPLCSGLLGESSLPFAAVYDQLGSFLLLSTVAPVALAKVGGGARVAPRELARRVLLFPPFIALLVALLPLPRPAALEAVLSAAAAPLVPLAMFAVGLKLRFTPPRPGRVFALGLGLKLFLFPVIGWALARALGAQGMVLKVAVLETAMPTMITAGALLVAYGVAVELAAAFVSWGLILSLVTVPLWSLLIR